MRHPKCRYSTTALPTSFSAASSSRYVNMVDRPTFLHRSRSHVHEYRTSITQLFTSRTSSPHQPDVISSAKPVEEETLPKYNSKAFYPVRLGEVLQDRYKVVAKLGYGMTATVWLAKDLQATADQGNRKFVTIKINVNTLSEEFQKGRREIATKLLSTDPKHPGYTHVRFMLDTFKVKGRDGEHLCIVYDVLREPIHMCMEKWPGKLFNAERLRILLPGLLQGLDYMHDKCGVVHTDLKPDNIMMGLGDPGVLDRFLAQEMTHPSPRKMPDSHGRIIYQSCSDFGESPTDAVIRSAKITDIGLAEWGDKFNNKPIQSNAFTAPEVILAAGWSYPADIWNFGVMLWDLVEHFGLFDGIDTRPGHYHSDRHLGLMIALMGPPPPSLIERGSTSATYFDEKGEFRYPNLVPHDFTFESSITRFKGEEKELFIDFAKKMICWCPEDRWTAKQLLEHDFLTKEREPRPEMCLEPDSDFLKTTDGPGSKAPSMTTTPKITPVPSFKNLAERGRASTGLSTSSNASNVSSQELIDSILGNKKRTSP